jgi:arylsulfatase A-like enzyme
MAPFYKREFDPRPEEELYDLRKDPHQLANVAKDPAYEADRAALWARLREILVKTEDPRVTEAEPRYERPPYAGPFTK